jgi:hypothetical protein
MAREKKNADAKVAQFGPKQIDSFFERTRRYFGIFQTELKAVAIVDNLLTEEMGQYGGQANRYLVQCVPVLTCVPATWCPSPWLTT